MPLSPEWLVWASSNLAQGVAPTELIKVMVRNAIPEIDAIHCISTAHLHPSFKELSRLSQKLQKSYSVMSVIKKLKEQKPDYGVIKKIDVISAESFIEDYWTACYPVVIRGLTDDWPARSKWSFEWMADNYGDELIEIQEGRSKDPEFELNSI
jgi:hypothetical protein